MIATKGEINNSMSYPRNFLFTDATIPLGSQAAKNLIIWTR